MPVWFLVWIDVLATAAGIETAAALLRTWFFPFAQLGFEGTTVTTTSALLVGVVGGYVTGLDDTSTIIDRQKVVVRSVFVASMLSLAALVVSHYVWFQPVGRIALALLAVCTATFLVGWRLVYAGFIERGPRIPMIMVGDSPQELRFAERLNALRHTRYRVVGYLADDESSRGARTRAVRPVETESTSSARSLTEVPNVDALSSDKGGSATTIPIVRLGTLDNAADVFARHGVDWALVASSSELTAARLGMLSTLQGQGVRISTAGSLWMTSARQVPVDLVDARWILDTFDQLDRPFVGEAKRLFDLTVALGGIVVLAALLPLLYLLVRLDSPGPFFYAQPRIGFAGRPFTLYKIRTMRAVSDASVQRWASSTDNRITRVGRIMRRFRIDELPQFFNVLRGDMSLVGPRPEQPSIMQELDQRIAFFRYRHLVKPGITGWAQIHQGYVASVEDSATKLSYDLYYVARHTLFLDLDIILRTFYVMLARIGSR